MLNTTKNNSGLSLGDDVLKYGMKEKIIQKYLFLFLLALLGAFLIYELFQFVPSVLGALVFYILFKKFMIRLVEQYKIKKSLAAIIIIIITFVIAVLPHVFLRGIDGRQSNLLPSESGLCKSISGFQKSTE